MNWKSDGGDAPRRLLRGGRVLNVFTGELLAQDILIEGDRIAAVMPRQEGAGDDTAGEAGQSFVDVIDAADRIVVPGYVEPHAHIGLMAEPVATLEQMARTGTTALVVDTYPFMVALEDDELERVLDHMQKLPTYVRWFLAPHARSFLVGEDDVFSAQRVRRWLFRDDVVAVGELTRWPLVAAGDGDLLDKMERARRAGKRVEGHGAGASGPRLQRLLWHGVTSDHEGITPEQVLERVRLGLYTMLRHSSLRPDLPHLLRVFEGDGEKLQHSNRIMLTADGPTPVWMDEHGYLDHLIRLGLQGGLDPAAAYRMASLNPAMYYRIEHDVGAIAPGRRANMNLLRDLSDPTPALVIARGRVVARDGRLVEPFPEFPWAELAGMTRRRGRAPAPELFRFGGGGRDVGDDKREKTRIGEQEDVGGGEEIGADIPTLEVVHTVLLRRAEGPKAGGPDASGPEPLRVAVYDWRGRWITRAFVRGFVDRLGGLATSYSPAYEVTVMGQDEDDMAAAAARVMEAGGGLCVVERGEVVFWLPLERAGWFNEWSWPELVAKLAEFEELMRERGYRGRELLYALFFFGFDSLPDYRLTVHGVWDVRRQRVVSPPLRLPEPEDDPVGGDKRLSPAPSSPPVSARLRFGKAPTGRTDAATPRSSRRRRS